MQVTEAELEQGPEDRSEEDPARLGTTPCHSLITFIISVTPGISDTLLLLSH